MLRLFAGSTIFYQGKFVKQDFIINNSQNFEIYDPQKHSQLEFDEVINCEGMHAFPGFIDPHVHLREPGFEYKDTIKTGTLSAAKGGYTSVFAMPNLNPVPDSLEHLEAEKDAIARDAVINVYPVCAITKGQTGRGELADIDDLKNDNRLFSDDGKGVQAAENMEAAMKKIAEADGFVLAHCEDEAELAKGDTAAAEYVHVERDLKLTKKTGCKYHICHMSTKQSVNALRKYKNEKVSGEVTCHHLFLNENNVQDNGAWKMNPPLRSVEDQNAVVEGLLDGTIEMICTDNAPHSAQEKDCKFSDAAMGIVSIEVAFPLVYTKLVKTGKLPLERAIKLMSTNAAKFFEIPGGEICENAAANICIYNLDEQWTIDSSRFASLGKSCPFNNEQVFGKCMMTICNGEIVFREMN